jgi:hypothetical protein
MEIAPIAGIRVSPAIRQRPVQPELTAEFEIEQAARPDEDTYTRSGKKAAGAEEENEDQPEEPEDAAGPEASSGSLRESGSNISLFA